MIATPSAGRRKPTRRVVWVVAGMLAALVAPLAMSLSSQASADTTGTPDPTVVATVGSQTNVAPNTTALTALHNGTTVSITVTAPGNLAGVDARQCWGGANISLQAQFNPTQGGNCVDIPLGAGDDFVTNTVGAPNNTVTFPFKVGEGIRTVSYGSGNSRIITCDVTTACTLWVKVAVLSGGDAAGAVWKHYNLQFAGAPTAPQTVAATGGNQSVGVSWAAPASNGGAPITSYDVTLTDGVTPVTQTIAAPATTANFTGLTNFTSYSATVVATNTAADGFHYPSPASAAATATPVPPGPTGLAGSSGNGSVALSWTAPVGPAPSGYEVVYCSPGPCAPATVITTGSTAASYNLTGLTNGTVYNILVRARYGADTGGPSNTITITPNSTLITQTITVTRPQGALVLTQVCGAHGATTTGSAPTFGAGTDPLYPGYPYPEDATTGEPVPANYPTDCAINLGTARLVKTGPQAGQFFETSGFINQVTVVDTRDTDPGWTVNGQMGTFQAGINSFSGSQLGWHPIVTSVTPGFTDASGVTYGQTVLGGATVLPNTAGGLGDGEQLAQAAAGQGLGISRLDADLDLLIPIFSKSGVYTGVLTITAI